MNTYLHNKAKKFNYNNVHNLNYKKNLNIQTAINLSNLSLYHYYGSYFVIYKLLNL